ncbi:hypothetical protein SAMN05920897_1422 [Alkalispirochaeta americana]|uniref:Uncharacterized protein n=1 Tax=Alkalispirochaeta americana TaxID=159291 RepID=A0A1N6Y7Q1_9SPIO|nr:hypothetical protein SAMN05920897_1422 [Alkalispirochaeta americana]
MYTRLSTPIFPGCQALWMSRPWSDGLRMSDCLRIKGPKGEIHAIAEEGERVYIRKSSFIGELAAIMKINKELQTIIEGFEQ